MEVRRVVTGYDQDGNLGVTSDSILQSLGKSPAGEAVALWSSAAIPTSLEDAGALQRSTVVKWFLVKVPPDKDRGSAANDYEPGILHEGDTIDLVMVVSGEVWL